VDFRSDGITVRCANSTGQPGLDDELVAQLSAVKREDPYYEPSFPKSRAYELLCKLERLGYIRYCPYPEDFWVILPAGRELLSRRSP
jgi:hypothetical protein